MVVMNMIDRLAWYDLGWSLYSAKGCAFDFIVCSSSSLVAKMDGIHHRP
jgi:hypothetical protein